MMAEVLDLKPASLNRWIAQRHSATKRRKKRGRPPAISAEVRDKIRACYTAHYKQWGPCVLSLWAKRQGLGQLCPTTIARVIADLVDRPTAKTPRRRYEITAPLVMLSIDGANFYERGKKHQALVLQDECSRFKPKARLAQGKLTLQDVLQALRTAFETHGVPLVLKHDGDPIFCDDQVQRLLETYRVVDLTSPPYYPPFNGKMERGVRDIRGYERAMRKHRTHSSLRQRLMAAMHDLNMDRPRPMLGGRTAWEVYSDRSQPVPERGQFYKEVMQAEDKWSHRMHNQADKHAARRMAVQEVLLSYGVMKETTDVSTNSNAKSVTN